MSKIWLIDKEYLAPQEYVWAHKVDDAIIKRYIEEGSLDIADAVYYSAWEAEEIALQTKREMKKKLLK